jgi:hypothetical protein
MQRPTRTAVAAFALGLGVCWAAPYGQTPAHAQSLEAPAAAAQTNDEPAGDPQGVDPQAAEAQKRAPTIEAWLRERRSEDADPPADAPRSEDRRSAPTIETWLRERQSEDAGQTPDAAPRETADAPPRDAADAARSKRRSAPTIDSWLRERRMEESGQAVDTPADDARAGSDGQGADAQAAAPEPVLSPAGTVAQMAAWVIGSGDNDGRPFVIVDKLAANVFVFDVDGHLMGGAPALVGLAPGDDSADGVGDRELSAIGPDDRTTPAGRFVAGFGPARGGRTVLWVDFATAISLHPVVTSNPKEHRLERIKSPAPEDHRITFGCINVPAAFYKDVVLQAFGGGSGVVYILPDTKPIEAVFPAFAALTGAHGAPTSAASQDPQPDARPDPTVAAQDHADNVSDRADGEAAPEAPAPEPVRSAGADRAAQR